MIFTSFLFQEHICFQWLLLYCCVLSFRGPRSLLLESCHIWSCFHSAITVMGINAIPSASLSPSLSFCVTVKCQSQLWLCHLVRCEQSSVILHRNRPAVPPLVHSGPLEALKDWNLPGDWGSAVCYLSILFEVKWRLFIVLWVQASDSYLGLRPSIS